MELSNVIMLSTLVKIITNLPFGDRPQKETLTFILEVTVCTFLRMYVLGWAIFSESYGINTKIPDHVRTCLGVTWSKDEASGTSGTPDPLSISKIMDLCLF